jgi:excinuclease UvrABC nuclease subunit
MDSTGLRGVRKEFDSWHSFESLNVQRAPSEIGVYIIRQEGGKLIGRLQGESDILYIGSTISKGGLRQRLMQYFHPGPTQWTNQRLNSFLEKYAMEITWCACSNPTNFEHDLLRKYLNDHDELPPFNHADNRRPLETVGESTALIDKLTVTKTGGKQ